MLLRVQCERTDPGFATRGENDRANRSTDVEGGDVGSCQPALGGRYISGARAHDYSSCSRTGDEIVVWLKSERRKFCYVAEEFGVERFRAEFFEVARNDGLSGGRWVFTGKGEFDEIMTCYEGCGGFGVTGYWIWIFNDVEVDPRMRIVP